jgi:hypothetical protein
MYNCLSILNLSADVKRSNKRLKISNVISFHMKSKEYTHICHVLFYDFQISFKKVSGTAKAILDRGAKGPFSIRVKKNV